MSGLNHVVADCADAFFGSKVFGCLKTGLNSFVQNWLFSTKFGSFGPEMEDRSHITRVVTY